ncbi:MAG TPA: ArsA-related P-loop ATPase [Thermoanaerobaculia bacterium]|jgi:anion-transporting  ArsA/GET3 family ATPase|nr:ArsA-related P-loop ATPase [Thermoanaerobaculia bacterium]
MIDLTRSEPPLVVVVGAGGVGKTTLAAAMGVQSASAGIETLVMTFDPSLRLKDALGVGDEARDAEVRVAGDAWTDRSQAGLWAGLLDARRTFDRLVERYAPDTAARDRILGNRFYSDLAGSLAGILEYMAVERLWEAWQSRRWQRIVLDTPPTRQALDFLEAPQRIIDFLDSGALRIALRPWFDEAGRLNAAPRWGGLGTRLGRSFEGWLDQVVGLDLLRDMAEFFAAFAPLFAGFRERAVEVQALLRSEATEFVLVAGPGEERNADTLFFARRLREAGYHLGPIVVNRIHPRWPALPSSEDATQDGRALLAWLGERDARGVAALQKLLPGEQPLLALPLLSAEPVDLAALAALGDALRGAA